MKIKHFREFLQHNKNVLIEGPHGVGKTAVVKQVFNEAGLNWRYFSASTMDPWCDFIGIPRPSEPDKNGNQHLEMILPKEFADDKVEALFFDEFNRAPDKVTNAVMELIQFKSINGRKFNNLRVIWCAVNPSDEEDIYNVNRIDPAIRDRFHIHVEVKENYIDSKYFESQYGEISKKFIQWWREKGVCKLVSPRRLEYAIQSYNDGIDLDYILPFKSNVKHLKDLINPKVVNIDENKDKNGNYTYEELIDAIKKGSKVNLNLKNSNALMNPLVLKDNPRILNYIHQEALMNAFNKPYFKNKAMTTYIMNYDENLSTNDNFTKQQIEYIKKHIDRAPAQLHLDKTNFYKKFYE